MSGNVIAEGVVKLTADGGPMGSAISSALSNLRKPLSDVKAAGESSAGGIGGAFSKAGGMVAAGMAVAGVAAIGFAIKAADTFKNVGGEVLKLQRYTGGSAESMSKLRFAAQQSGVDTDKLAKSMGFLSKNLVSGKANFDQYGIATLDAHGKTLPLDGILLNVAAKFKEMPNGVDKTAMAIRIFGKAGADMIPMLNKGKDGLMALEQQATKYGLVLTSSNIAAVKAATAAHREQTAAMQGLQVQIGANVLPVLTRLTKAFTEGLMSAMPTVTAIMNTAVIPAFSAFATVISSTAGFVEHHAGLVKGLAVVVASLLLPALGIWVVEQAALMASGFLMFLSNSAGAIIQVATKMGLMSAATGTAGASMTSFGLKAAGALALVAIAVSLVIAENNKMNASAQKASDALVKGAKSPQEAIGLLTKRQAELHAEMGGGLNVMGLHIFALDSQAKKAAAASKEYKDNAEKLRQLKDDTKAHADATTKAGDAVDESLSKQGLAMETLGGATRLTKDQIEQLAASMKIDLTKAGDAQIASMVDQADRLSITAEHTLKLKDANEVLADWTKTATEKTAAFKTALDALVTTETSAEGTTISWRQTLADTVTALKALKYSADLTTQAGRDYQSQVLKSVDATVKMIEEDQKRLGQGPELQALEAQHVADLKSTWSQAGMTTAQIQALLEQYKLTPHDLTTIVTLNASGAFQTLAALRAQFAQFQISQAAANSGNAYAAQAAAAYAAGPPHRAKGGPTQAGMPYLIGEEGPEIMVPGAGTILPNSAVRSAGGGATYINVHVAGDVTSEGRLINTIRTGINTYNARSGSGR